MFNRPLERGKGDQLFRKFMLQCKLPLKLTLFKISHSIKYKKLAHKLFSITILD
jgi:hypothetical protein